MKLYLIILMSSLFLFSCKDDSSKETLSKEKREDLKKKFIDGSKFDAQKMVAQYKDHAAEGTASNKVILDYPDFEKFIDTYNSDAKIKIVPVVAQYDEDDARLYADDWNAQYPAHKIDYKDVLNHQTIVFGICYEGIPDPIAYRAVAKICPPPPNCDPGF